MALGFRPGQADERLSAAVTAPPVSRVELEQLSEAEAAAAGPGRESAAAIYRHGGGNPFFLEQLGRASGDDLRPVLDGGAGGWRAACPAAVRGAIAGELESLSRPVASVPRRRRRRRRAVRAGSRRHDRGAVRAGGPRRARRPAGARPGPADGGTAPFHLPPPTGAPCRLRIGARRLEARGPRKSGGCARRARRSGGRARSPRRAVRRAGGPRGDRSAARSGPRRRSRAPAAAARWFEAALRLLPSGDTERQVERARGARFGAAVGRRAGPVPGHSSSRRRTCSTPRPSRGGSS